MTDYFDIGNFHSPITTDSADTQLWFNRGLTWCYGFNHKEGLLCFEKAIKTDKNCPMAWWGIAYSLGPNYNKAWRMFDKKDLEICVPRAHNAVRHAHELASQGKCSLKEKALITGLQARFPSSSAAKDLEILMNWSRGYADDMKIVYNEFGDDLDVAALTADALVCLTPWALWDIRTGKPATGSRVVEAKAILDHAFTQDKSYSHPGLLHFYIHLIEMSTTPEAGLKAADNLRGLCPDAGHLNHMPSHLDVLVGDYRTAVSANAAAVKADLKFVARDGILNFYSMYRMHTYQSLIYAAMLAGQSNLALETAKEMEKNLTEELLRIESPPMADWLESFLSIRMHVLVRFGRWDEILKYEIPKDQELYSVTAAMTHYAKGVAYAAVGRIDEGIQERTAFKAAYKCVPATRLDFPNKMVDVLEVADSMLDGELEYRRKNFDDAWIHLRKAVELDDNLVYSEPWGWPVPTRHALGALLLEQGYVKEAAKIYAEDLGFDTSLPPGHRHPNNIFALHGYHECLKRLDKHAEAQLLEQSLKLGAAVADIPIKSSCFCRLSAQNNDTNNGSCH